MGSSCMNQDTLQKSGEIHKIIEIQFSISNKKEGDKKIAPMGLTNKGLRCYLNSSIQLFYAKKKLRDYLRKKVRDSKFQSEMKLTQIFGRLFKAMRSDDEKDKNLYLDKIFSLISKEMSWIIKGYQQDIKEVYNFLEAKLCEEDEELANYFIWFTQKTSCIKCADFNVTQKDKSVWIVDEKCSYCSTSLKKQILGKEPSYLTVISRYNEKAFQYSLVVQGKNNEQIEYSLIAFAVYLGTGSSGHYLSCIKQKNEWIQLNDSRVSTIDESTMKRYEKPLCIYAREWKTKE